MPAPLLVRHWPGLALSIPERGPVTDATLAARADLLGRLLAELPPDHRVQAVLGAWGGDGAAVVAAVGGVDLFGDIA